MATSLYDMSVASYQQTLNALSGVLDKSLAHFTANNVNLHDVVETRLFADMLPFRFQIQAVVHQSLGAIEGIKKGVFLPPANLASHDYRELQKLITDTRDTFAAMKPAEVNALEGRDVVFEIRGMKIPFTAEGFIMSFSLPNFYFHATTAYDILRAKGVPVGKRDFMGALHLKR